MIMRRRMMMSSDLTKGTLHRKIGLINDKIVVKKLL